MPPNAHKQIAHDALCLTELPLLQYQRGGQFLRRNKLACTKSASPGPSFNFIAALEQPLPALAEILPVAEQFFGPDRSAYGILVEGGNSEQLETELQQNSYTVFEDEPAFVRHDLSDITVSDHPLQISAVTTEPAFREYNRLVAEIFNAPPEIADDLMPIACLREPNLRLFLGEYEGKFSSAVCYLIMGGTAHVAGTATLPALRGRGFGSALVMHALADAREQGCTAAALRSGPLSIPLYQRLGFRYVCQHRTYAFTPANKDD